MAPARFLTDTPICRYARDDSVIHSVKLLSGKLELVRSQPKSLQQYHPGEAATWTMTTHPDHSQDVPMALQLTT